MLNVINNLLSIFNNATSFFAWIFKNKKEFHKKPHYFKNYHKHVTIYRNGHGIIINSFDIVFNNHDTEFLERGINIEDGKIDANFTTLKEMRDTLLENRFDKLGFWVYSDDRIIESVVEKYWNGADEHTSENVKSKNNPKELQWVFKFNHSKIKLNTPYHVVYILSIPGMFPIENGKLDTLKIYDPNTKSGILSSSINIINAVLNLKYTVSFENGIDLEMEPNALFKELEKKDKNTHPHLEHEYDIIYNKYICNIKKPQLGSNLKITWKFEGGNDND